MNIVFVETEKNGHHISLYSRLLFKELTKKNKIFLITNKSVSKSDEFKTLDPYLNRVKVYNIKNQKKPTNYTLFNIFIFHLKNLIEIFLTIKKINKLQNIDRIYFNHLDPYIFIFLFVNFFLKLNINVSGLLLNIKFHQYYFDIKKYSYIDSIKLYLFKKFIKNNIISKVFIIDEQFINFLKKKKISSKKIIKISEAVYKKKSKTIDNNKKKKYQKKKVLLYGSIHLRKGIHIIKKINENSEIRKNVIFTLAGKFDLNSMNYVKNNLNSFKNVIILNKFIDDNLESKLIKSTDLVWLCYTSGSDGSSGVMQLAALYFKPIIYSNRGLINYLATKYKLGYKVNLEKNLINQFKEIFFKNYKKTHLNRSIKRYIDNLSYNNFEKKITLELEY